MDPIKNQPLVPRDEYKYLDAIIQNVNSKPKIDIDLFSK